MSSRALNTRRAPRYTPSLFRVFANCLDGGLAPLAICSALTTAVLTIIGTLLVATGYWKRRIHGLKKWRSSRWTRLIVPPILPNIYSSCEVSVRSLPPLTHPVALTWRVFLFLSFSSVRSSCSRPAVQVVAPTGVARSGVSDAPSDRVGSLWRCQAHRTQAVLQCELHRGRSTRAIALSRCSYRVAVTVSSTNVNLCGFSSSRSVSLLRSHDMRSFCGTVFCHGS